MNYQNRGLGNSTRSSEDAGQLTYNPFVFDFAAAAGYRPATLVATDTIQIGEIPAGEVLVPHLCRIDIPVIDSNGSPTGDYTVGAAADPDALKGSAAAETAVTLSGEDFVLTTSSSLGDRDAPVPIYLTFTNPIATIAPTGKIVASIVSRPWDSAIDGQ